MNIYKRKAPHGPTLSSFNESFIFWPMFVLFFCSFLFLKPTVQCWFEKTPGNNNTNTSGINDTTVGTNTVRAHFPSCWEMKRQIQIETVFFCFSLHICCFLLSKGNYWNIDRQFVVRHHKQKKKLEKTGLILKPVVETQVRSKLSRCTGSDAYFVFSIK